MLNKFCLYPLWEVTATLSAVAMGRIPADTVIKNAKLINVCTREIIEHTDVAISKGRIALVGDAAHCIGANTEVIDASGSYIAPGFLDGHLHIESSMLSASEYARATIPHGTVGIFPDPHEICNVLGLDGVKCMIEDSRHTPQKTMFTIPSCVPAVPGFEDSGANINSTDIKEAMTWDDVVGLGEMMNFPGILNSDKETHAIVAETLKADKIVTGHYSMPETGKGLNAYIAMGTRNCHESTRAIDALEKMRRGETAFFREGSAWHDLKEVSKAIVGKTLDTRYASLCSDDAHPNTLIGKGHLDHIIRRAMEEGIDVLTAIQMVTINTATSFRMDHELGSIAPSKCADIVFIDDLERFNVTRVIIDGKTVALDGRLTIEIPPYRYPDWATNSVNIGETITPDSFKIKAPNDKNAYNIRIIEVIPARVGTIASEALMHSIDGYFESDKARDILKAVVFERHKATGKKGFGFVKGFGISDGAMASTVAHDAHNLMVIGTNDYDMALAANTLIASGGGLVTVQNGKVLAHVALPIAGLMNDKTAEALSAEVEMLERSWDVIGCKMPSPFMTMALIPLACLPELRLTNRGLVDSNEFKFVDLIVDQ